MRLGLLVPLLLLTGCGVGTAATPVTAPAPQSQSPEWRSSAAQPMSDVRAAPARDETCRQVLRLSVGGPQLRLRLSNVLSPTTLSLAAVTVGIRSDGAAARAGSLHAATVDGAASFAIAPGQQVTTDPVPLPVGDGEDVLVSFAVRGSARLSEHRFGAATGWCSGPGTGDLTTQLPAAGFPGGTREGLVVEEVAVPAAQPALVAVGDSLTDALLPPDTYPRWTDVVDRRLPGTPVVNAAIAGNRVLLQGGLGPTLVERFERDVLQRTGAGTVLLLAGTNDLARDLPAADLQRELERLVSLASQRGLRVVLMTIPPADERTAAQQAARRQLNAWIRSTADVVDADAVLRDPRRPERLAPRYDHGDGLHLSPAGHEALGEAVARALR